MAEFLTLLVLALVTVSLNMIWCKEVMTANTATGMETKLAVR